MYFMFVALRSVLAAAECLAGNHTPGAPEGGGAAVHVCGLTSVPEQALERMAVMANLGISLSLKLFGERPLLLAGPRTARLPSRVAERTARPACKGHLVCVEFPEAAAAAPL